MPRRRKLHLSRPPSKSPIADAHLPEFLLPKHRLKAVAKSLRADPPSHRLQSRPQRPKSAASVRNSCRRRVYYELMQVQPSMGRIVMEHKKKSIKTESTILRKPLHALNDDMQRRIIELSVGIEQLLSTDERLEREREGKDVVAEEVEEVEEVGVVVVEEERAVAKLSACLAALSSHLIQKKKRKALSLKASAELAKLLVLVRTGYDAEHLKQRSHVRRLKREVQRLNSQLQEYRKHVVIDVDGPPQKIEGADIDSVVEDKEKCIDNSDLPVAIKSENEMCNSSQFLGPHEVLYFSRNHADGNDGDYTKDATISQSSKQRLYIENPMRNIEKQGLLCSSSKLVDPWLGVNQNRQLVSSFTQTDTELNSKNSTSRHSKLVIDSQYEVLPRQSCTDKPKHVMNLTHRGTQVVIKLFTKSTQSVGLLTRSTACQTETQKKTHTFVTSNCSVQTTTTYDEGQKSSFKLDRESSMSNPNVEDVAVPNLLTDANYSLATSKLLAITAKEANEDVSILRPWTPAESEDSNQYVEKECATPISTIAMNHREDETNICSKQIHSSGSIKVSQNEPLGPGALFGAIVADSSMLIKTRLFSQIQSCRIRSQKASSAKHVSLNKIVQYIRELFDLSIKNRSLEGQLKANSGLPDVVEADFVQRFGVRSIVDQKIFELLVNLSRHRYASREVEYFSQLMEESLRPKSEFHLMLLVRQVCKMSSIGEMLSQPHGYGDETLDLDRALDVCTTLLSRLEDTPPSMKKEVFAQIETAAGKNKSFSEAFNSTKFTLSLVDLLDILAVTVKNVQTRKAIIKWSHLAFESEDVNCNGFITYSQFQHLFERLDPPPSKRVIEIAFHSGIHKSFSKQLSRRQFIGAAANILKTLPLQNFRNKISVGSSYSMHSLPDLSQAVPIWPQQDGELDKYRL